MGTGSAKHPPPATAGTAKPRRLIDPRRVGLKKRLREIGAQGSRGLYDPILAELAEIAPDVERAMERRQSGAAQTGVDLVEKWESRERAIEERHAAQMDARSRYRSSDPAPQPARTRSNLGCKTPMLPRSRSREQSHAARRTARSTPKAASRSGDSGDSSPPGEPPPPRKAVYRFGCEARERWGLS